MQILFPEPQLARLRRIADAEDRPVSELVRGAGPAQQRTRGRRATVNSIDTNIPLYAINRDCPEHGAAIRLVRRALAEPSSWIVADQVWLELYRLLRNPSVLSAPLSATDASST